MTYVTLMQMKTVIYSITSKPALNLLDFVFLRPQREMLGWIFTLFFSKQ